MSVYGYCRTYNNKEKLKQQEANIQALFPDAIILKDKYNPQSEDKKWLALQSKLKEDDTVIFDSILRMSKSYDECLTDYLDHYNKGINLIFIKERYLDTSCFKDEYCNLLQSSITNYEDVRQYIYGMIRRQIKVAFNQMEQDSALAHTKISEGLKKTKKSVGRKYGKRYKSSKEDKAKKIIQEYSKAFNGELSDKEVMEKAGVSRNTYYKYKNELLHPVIDDFRGKYGFLSNFYRGGIPITEVFDGVEISYPHVEGAYQANKSTSKEVHMKFSYILDPAIAKRRGRELDVRQDWDDVKYSIMFKFVRQKFSLDDNLKQKLLDTGNAYLIENTLGWCDNYWGNCNCRKCKDIEGQNNLGKILMLVRDELRGDDNGEELEGL